MAENLNMIIDQVSGVAKRYGVCKNDCFKENPVLAERVKE